MQELISIIIPVYKVENYIHRCIDSIINQTYQNLEIILIDDGSPDRCGEICDDYAKKDKRIRVIHKRNEGQSEARNQGLALATGKYIGFVDSDDYIKNNMFEVLYHNIIEYGVQIAIGNIVTVSKNKKEIVENHKEIEFYKNEEILRELLKNNISNYVYNKLYTKKLWDDIKFPKGKILEDMDVMYKILEKVQTISCTNQTEYYYCIRENSSISEINKSVTDNLKEIVKKRYRYLQGRRPDLLDLLNIDYMSNIIRYHYNLSHCREKKEYNKIEMKKEYEFFHKNYKKYKMKLQKNETFRKKIEMELLYINRHFYYNYSILRNTIKKWIKK